MLRELRGTDGGIASALDADSEGEEGRFYTWDHGEFMTVLREAGLNDAAARLLAAYWGVTHDGNWEGRNVLHVSGRPAPEAELLERGRAALLASRERRPRPGKDEKRLAAWNGLALRALGVASLVLGDARYVEAAERLVAFLRAHLVRDGDRLWRTARDGAAHTPGFAEDYANVADGMLAAYAALGEAEHLDLAGALMERAVAEFWDESSGTLFDTGPEHDRTVARPRSLIDSAVPSANAVAADVFMRLALLLGEPDHDRRARSILRAVAPTLERQPTAFGRMLGAADRALGEPLDAVVAGEPAEERAVALRRAVARPYAPDLVIAPLAIGSRLAALPLFAG
jgi:uncharacterized protein YyaL (SSP411 family)